MNYQSIGSGGGIAQIKAKTVDFGASDMPLKPEDLQAAGLIQFPAIIGGVVPVVNLEGIAPGALRFTGPVLADIYLGKIKTLERQGDRRPQSVASSCPPIRSPWCAARTAPGTSFIWTDYLSKVSPEWKTKVGASTAVAWPEGVGGKGNEGVAAYVQRIKGSIGYVEYAYAKKNKMTTRPVQNKDGQFVQPDDDTFRRGRCVRRLEERARLLPDPHRPAGQDELADHRRVVHPDARRSRTSRRTPPKCSKFFDWALQERQGDGRRNSTTCRCRTPWSKIVEDAWQRADQGSRRQSRSGTDAFAGRTDTSSADPRSVSPAAATHSLRGRHFI